MTARQPPHVEDGGFTLIEVLVALAIVGVAMVAVLGEIGLNTKVSGLHEQQGDSGIVLASTAERLVDPSTIYMPCATTTTASYLSAARAGTVPQQWTSSGWTVANAIAITSVLYWNGSGFTSTCNDTTTGDTDETGQPIYPLQMQQITLAVHSPQNQQTDSITIVKRAP